MVCTAWLYSKHKEVVPVSTWRTAVLRAAWLVLTARDRGCAYPAWVCVLTQVSTCLASIAQGVHTKSRAWVARPQASQVRHQIRALLQPP
jgi:hypothetical protein